MRGRLAGTAASEKPRGKKAKRRYDVALNTPGVEIQLPSLPRIALGWRLLSGLLVVLLGTAAYSLWNLPLFQVEGLQIEGLHRITSEELNAVADVVGQSILLVEPGLIEEDILKAFPDLSEVSVAIKIPASVVVKAVERVPVITWKQGENVFWIDSTGVVFPMRGDDGPSIVIKADNLPLSTISQTPQLEGESMVESSEDNQSDSLQIETVSEPASVVLPQALVQAILVMSESRITQQSVTVRTWSCWKDSRVGCVFWN
jgi:cell division protein FtsQ